MEKGELYAKVISWLAEGGLGKVIYHFDELILVLEISAEWLRIASTFLKTRAFRGYSLLFK